MQRPYIVVAVIFFQQYIEKLLKKAKQQKCDFRKHRKQCYRDSACKRWKQWVLHNKNLRKTLKKTLAYLHEMLYTTKACVRRWGGKLPCYRRISTEKSPLRWGRRDSLNFCRVKTIRNTRKRVRSKQFHCTRWKHGIWTPCTSIAKTVQKRKEKERWANYRKSELSWRLMITHY